MVSLLTCFSAGSLLGPKVRSRRRYPRLTRACPLSRRARCCLSLHPPPPLPSRWLVQGPSRLMGVWSWLQHWGLRPVPPQPGASPTWYQTAGLSDPLLESPLLSPSSPSALYCIQHHSNLSVWPLPAMGAQGSFGDVGRLFYRVDPQAVGLPSSPQSSTDTPGRGSRPLGMGGEDFIST